MFCTRCGSQIADDVKFCTNCGAPVERVVPREAVARGSEAAGVADAVDAAEPTVPHTPASGGASAVGSERAPAAAPGSLPGSTAVQPPVAVAPKPAASAASGREEQPAARKRLIGAIVAAAAAVGVLAGVGVAAALTGGFGLIQPAGQQAGSAKVEVAASEEPSAADGEADDAPAENKDVTTPADQGGEPAAKQETGAADSAAAPAPAASTVSIDLNNEADRRELNVNLSNFTELVAGLNAHDHFCRDDALTDEMRVKLIQLIQYHVAYNNLRELQSVPADDPLSGQFSMRIKAADFNRLLNTLVGMTLSEAQMAYDNNPGETQQPNADRGLVENGYFYYTYETGVAWGSQGIAHATSVTDLGGNRYKVAFDVYKPGKDLLPSKIKRETYGLPKDQLCERIGATGVAYSASAIVDVTRAADGTLDAVLYQMN